MSRSARRAAPLAALALALLLASGALAQTSSPAKPVGGPPAPDAPAGWALTLQPGYHNDGHPTLPRGLALPFLVSLRNPTEEAREGTILLQATGDAETDLGEIAFSLRPRESLAWPILLWVNGTRGGIAASADGVPGASFSAEWNAFTPLSVVLSSPERERNAGAQERVAFRASATNHGDEPVSTRLALHLGDRIVAERALDPPLAPGETRAVDFGEHLPPVPEELRGRADGQMAFVRWRVLDVGGDAQEPAQAIRFEEGRVASAMEVAGVLRVSTGALVRLVVEHAALGEPSVVRAILRHDGDEPVEARLFVAADSPVLRLHRDWKIPRIDRLVRLEPGEETEVRVEWVPRVAAALRFHAGLGSSRFHVSDYVEVDLASPVRVSPSEDAWALRASAGDRVAWSLDVSSSRDLPDARLRVLVAPRVGTAYDGLIREEDIVGATVTSAAEGTGIAAGVSRRFDVAIDARASGSYLVVPYVESGGIAYLGALSQEELLRMQQTPSGALAHEAHSLRSVVLLLNVLPGTVSPAAAFLPAGLVLVGTIGLWATRRWKVR